MVVKFAIKLEQLSIGLPRFVLKLKESRVLAHHLIYQRLLTCHLITLILIIVFILLHLVIYLTGFLVLLLVRLKCRKTSVLGSQTVKRLLVLSHRFTLVVRQKSRHACASACVLQRVRILRILTNT